MANPPPKDSGDRTLADLCKLTGLSAGRIAQAVKEGHVVKTGRGVYSVSAAIKGLFKFFDSHWGKLPTFDNVEQCSEQTGIPVSIIKGVRRKSKAPFVNQRIHLAPLLKEIFSETEDGDTNWKNVKDKWDALFSKARTERALELSMDRDQTARAIDEACAKYFQVRERWDQLEGPSSLKGCNEEQIRERLADASKRMDKALRETLSAGQGEKETAA
jgi:hypothetical protein